VVHCPLRPSPSVQPQLAFRINPQRQWLLLHIEELPLLSFSLSSPVKTMLAGMPTHSAAIIQSDTPAELVSSNSAVSGPSRLLLLLPAGIQEEQRWTEYLVTTIRGSEYSHLDTRGAGDDLGVGGVERALPKHATT
jgi:hypothetical protein